MHEEKGNNLAYSNLSRNSVDVPCPKLHPIGCVRIRMLVESEAAKERLKGNSKPAAFVDPHHQGKRYWIGNIGDLGVV